MHILKITAIISFFVSFQISANLNLLNTEKNKESYALGTKIAVNIDKNIQSIVFDNDLLNYSLVIQGVTDRLLDKEVFSKKQLDEIFNQYETKLNKKEIKEKNDTKNEGVNFLKKNKLKPDVVVSKSGLQYKVLTSNSNTKKPTVSSEVEVHYEGKLLNGTVFDSSYKRGDTAIFPLNRVISGWTEGLQYMPEGQVFEFYIPSNLAYGERGTNGIPPNSTLIFKVELIKILN
jgi:FKBP-type peptidyl-prolyl cis-trans isomerase FkpA